MLLEVKNEFGEEKQFLKNAKHAKTIKIFFEKYLLNTRPLIQIL